MNEVKSGTLLNIWRDNCWGMMPVTPGFCGADGNFIPEVVDAANRAEVINWFHDLHTIAQNGIIWEGLPDTGDARFMLKNALNYGYFGFVRRNGAIVTPAIARGDGPTFYGYFQGGYAYGMNGENWHFRALVPGADKASFIERARSYISSYVSPEGVIGLDNADGFPMIRFIFSAAVRLADIQRSMDVAAANMKHPYIYLCRNTVKKSLEDILSAKYNNELRVVGSNDLRPEEIVPIDTRVDTQVLGALQEHSVNTLNLALRRFGIDSNPNEDKRERQTVAEVAVNNQVTYHSVDRRLRYHKELSERVNDYFGLKTSVRINEEVAEFEETVADAVGVSDGEPDGGDGDVRGVDDRLGD